MALRTKFAVCGDWLETTMHTSVQARSRVFADVVATYGQFVLQAGDSWGGEAVSNIHQHYIDTAYGTVWAPLISPENAARWGTVRRIPGARYQKEGVQDIQNQDPLMAGDDWLRGQMFSRDGKTRWFSCWGNHDYDEVGGSGWNYQLYNFWFMEDYLGDVTQQLPDELVYQEDDPYFLGTSGQVSPYGRNQFYSFVANDMVEVNVVNNNATRDNIDGVTTSPVAFDYLTAAGSGTKWIYDKVQVASAAEWRVILTHYPPYSTGTIGQDTTDRGVHDPTSEFHSGRAWNAFMAGAYANSDGPTLNFSGHDHNCEINYKDMGGHRHWFFVGGTVGGATNPTGPKGTGGGAPLDFTTTWRAKEDGSGGYSGVYFFAVDMQNSYVKVDVIRLTNSDTPVASVDYTMYILKEGAMAYAVEQKHKTVRVFHGEQVLASASDIIIPLTGRERAVGIQWDWASGTATGTKVYSQYRLFDYADSETWQVLNKDIRVSDPGNKANNDLGTIGGADGICWFISGQGYDFDEEARAVVAMSDSFALDMAGTGTWTDIATIHHYDNVQDASAAAGYFTTYYGV